MTNRYLPVSLLAKATHGDAEVDLDLTPTEENDALGNGHLELVPRTYRVLSGRFSGGQKGELITAAFRVEPEQALIQGEHIERVDPAPRKKKD